MSKCTQCLFLKARVDQLEQEKKALLGRIYKLEKRIEWTKAVCKQLIQQADKVLTGHNPRGTWSYAKGAKEAAQTVVRYLQ